VASWLADVRTAITGMAQALPSTARTIALLLASTPTIADAQPGVLHQLLEFSHRYISQVLQDASVYAEHAGRQNKLEREDVVLAVQARVGWEFGGRVPKEYTHSLAAQTNALPLPAVPEVFGVRLPAAKHCLTGVDFDLVPHKPPPSVILYEDEEVEEEADDVEEDAANDHVLDEDEDADMEDVTRYIQPDPGEGEVQLADGATDEAAEDDGLFAGDDDEGEEAMESVEIPVHQANGVQDGPVQRKLVEDEDYD